MNVWEKKLADQLESDAPIVSGDIISNDIYHADDPRHHAKVDFNRLVAEARLIVAGNADPNVNSVFDLGEDRVSDLIDRHYDWVGNRTYNKQVLYDALLLVTF